MGLFRHSLCTLLLDFHLSDLTIFKVQIESHVAPPPARHAESLSTEIVRLHCLHFDRLPGPIDPGSYGTRPQPRERREQSTVFDQLCRFAQFLHAVFSQGDDENKAGRAGVAAPFGLHLGYIHFAAVVDFNVTQPAAINRSRVGLSPTDFDATFEGLIIQNQCQVGDANFVFEHVQRATATVNNFRPAGFSALHNTDYSNSSASSLPDEPSAGFFPARRQRSATEEFLGDLVGGGGVSGKKVEDGSASGSPYSGRA